MATLREEHEESIPTLSDQDLFDEFDPTKGKRKKMLPSKKRYQWNEIYGLFEPDSISSSSPPPDHVRVAFEELIGGEPEFKLRLHPWFKRWAAFEKVKGAGEGAYACFSVFMTEAKDGALPVDLDNSDGRYENMRGLMGQYRLPTRRDFEIIRRDADIERLGVDGVIQKLEEPEIEQEREAERVLEDHEWDILDYNYLAINAAANGGKLQMIAPNRDNSDIRARQAEKYHEETRTTEDGKSYKIRYKVGSRFHAKHIQEIEQKNKDRESFLDNLEKDLDRKQLQKAAKRALYGSQAKKVM